MFTRMQLIPMNNPAAFRRYGLIALSAITIFSASTIGAARLTAPDNSGLDTDLQVEMHTARIPIKDLAELTRKSDAVISGRVIARGATQFLPFSGGSPHPFQPEPVPSNLPGWKVAGLEDKPAAPTQTHDKIITPPQGIPMTEFTVEVTGVISGKLAKGQHISINQPGGTYQIPLGRGAPTLTRTLVAEHDPLLIPGSEQVLFVNSSSQSSTFTITGGPDGRFKLDAHRTLQPVDEGSPVGAAHKGETLDTLAKKVNSLRLHGTEVIDNQ
jgi:hypothetical protein